MPADQAVEMLRPLFLHHLERRAQAFRHGFHRIAGHLKHLQQMLKSAELTPPGPG